jgi:hypothetical protein
MLATKRKEYLKGYGCCLIQRVLLLLVGVGRREIGERAY